MGQTANGFPYPVGTDPVRDGDNAIKALAEAIESHFQTKRINGAVDALGAIGANFVSPTGAAPRAVLIGKWGDDSWAPTVARWNASITSTTPTRVNLRVWDAATGYNMGAGTVVVYDVLLVF
jgi:hypothetical protein